MNNILKEFCAENFTNVHEAVRDGARRIELCDDLSVGGTTPSDSVIKETVDFCNTNETTVMTMIRPRGGDFHYTDTELLEMIESIKVAVTLGTHGVVYGCLRPKQEGQSADETITQWELDKDSTLQLIDATPKDVEIVFHMAFDQILAQSLDAAKEAIDWLVEHNVNRILTHGGPSERNILENTGTLNQLLEYAGERITILPGGGITSANLPELSAKLPLAKEFHGTKIVQKL